MKFLILTNVCLILLTGCQLISPILTNYNGVRMDVASYINHAWRFSLKEREVLVAYAKQQQKISSWHNLNSAKQHSLAEHRLIGRYCAEQKISAKKLDLIDQQIFSTIELQTKLQAMYARQQHIQLDYSSLNCEAKF
ncbi:hypothetical protein [Acinetobacter sp. B51(2017)]|uniref:hypothetical protein n=1 Tax=Acinetobacter sp. B51(2017) TaxID=2060938 RepID=UPI000F0753C2|nr:hypothetical protein [Acinetobacter sp. B51(2017)]